MPENALADFEIPDLDPADALGRGEDEGLFARDEDDVLIRQEKATRKDFEETLRVVIDGYVLDQVPKAVPKTDSAGNPIFGPDGKWVPRSTTIYDAASMLVMAGRWTDDDLKQRMPILCHQPHMSPVAMCRMCSVHVSMFKRGKLTPNRKLVPACQHRVEPGMVVTTRLGAEKFKPARKALAAFAARGLRPTDGLSGPLKKVAELVNEEARKAKEELDGAARNQPEVNNAVTLLAEFLLADHRHAALASADTLEPYKDGRYENELEAVARTLGVAGPRDGLPVPDGGPHRNTPVAKPAVSGPRRLSLPTVQTVVEPEELDDPAARDAWVQWNREIDEHYPYSSRTVVVDHDRCILCDRCARACSEVKPFKVIGHTGKGYTARVSFDLDAIMSESSCVQCGECMTSCPTGALSLRRRVQPRNWDDSLQQIAQNPNTPFPEGSDFLNADEMRNVRLVYKSPRRKRSREVYPFRTIPYAYLKWNEGSVRRWTIPPGEKRELCREGEYGSTAFLLEGTGSFHIHKREGESDGRAAGLFARLFGKLAGRDDIGPCIRTLKGDQLVFGEMACLTHKPRTATVVAEADADKPMVVYEVTRNLLDMMQRTESARDDLREVYTARAIENVLRDGKHLRGLPRADREQAVDFLLAHIPSPRRESKAAGGALATLSDVGFDPMFDVLWNDPWIAEFPEELRRLMVAYLLPRVRPANAPMVSSASIFLNLPEASTLEFRRLASGEKVVAEGDTGRDFYLIRVGFLKVYSTTAGGRQKIVTLLKDGDYFGEMALLGDELKARGAIPLGQDTYKRHATVEAIDPSEVVRVPGDLFAEMCEKYPAIRDHLLEQAEKVLKPPATPEARLRAEAEKALTPAFVTQGLYMGQKMLALDLVSCTRCDECTKACADSHDGHSRLIREGLRFGDFLIATSCRSCHKPYCMEGCPVDAIHRNGDHLEVVIEDHCIGCSLCERNCPYGAIQMVPRKEGFTGPRTAAVTRQAVNCDLCNGGEPFCVSACPHEAAFRLDGNTLLGIVTDRAAAAGVP